MTSRRWDSTRPNTSTRRVEAIKLAMADRDTYLGDMDFIEIPYQRPAFEGVCRLAPQADRSRPSASLEFRPGDVAPFAGPGYKTVNRPRDVTSRRQCGSRRRHQLHRRGGPRPQHDLLHAEPAQRVRHQGRGGQSRVSSSTAAAITIRWFRATPTRSSPASGRAARCRARW